MKIIIISGGALNLRKTYSWKPCITSLDILYKK